MKKENKYVEPKNYFTEEALKVFGFDKKSQEEAKGDKNKNDKNKDDQKKKENEELRKVFKGNNNK